MGLTLDTDTKFYTGKDMNNQREEDFQRERHPTIELSDLEHLARISPQEYKVSTLITEVTEIPMILEIPLFEKQIRKGVKNAKSKSKIPEKKPKKNNSRTHKTAVESIQGKL